MASTTTSGPVRTEKNFYPCPTSQEYLDLLKKHVKFDKENALLTDYLRTWDLDSNTIHAVYYVARILERCAKEGKNCQFFNWGIAVSNFRDKSTRTRSAFASAASLLGLQVMDFNEATSQVSHGETTRESAVMLCFSAEAIGIRDDLFLGEGHKYQKEVAAALEESASAGVLKQRTCVVNLQCDEDHPTQSMADLMHLADLFGDLSQLKGKKIAVSWAYSPSYGKPLSVPQGLVALLPRFGMNVALAYPKGYELLPEVMDEAQKRAQEGGGSIEVFNSMQDAFNGADVVYPKSWAPMAVLKKRSELYRSGVSSSDVLKKLERECLDENAKHKEWSCTEEMMKITRKKDGQEANYMHCLPADISKVSCAEGEVDASVFERHRLATYSEASHKQHVIAASILLSRFPDVPSLFS